MNTWVIIPDTHFARPGSKEGGVDKKAFNCVLQAIELVKPYGLVHLGDIGEWESVSPWAFKKTKRPPLTYVLQALDKDYEAVSKGFNQLNEAADKAGSVERHVLEGNHEIWVQNLIDEVPELAEAYSVPKRLGLEELGWQFHRYGEYIRVGELSLYHGGHWSTAHHASQHVQSLKTSVMYGHYHDLQVAKVSSLRDGLHAAWSIGFLGEPKKAFLKGRPTNWSHNFAIVHVEKGGRFFVEVVEIFGGKCFVYGKEIKG